jgi:hypothetical protein
MQYNGWTNWETWAAVLWATNDEGNYREWICAAYAHEGDNESLANYLEEVVPQWFNGDIETAEEWAQVNWAEVAEACAEDAKA